MVWVHGLIVNISRRNRPCVVVRKNKSFRELPRAADLIFSRRTAADRNDTGSEAKSAIAKIYVSHCSSRRRYCVRRTATNPALISHNRRAIHPWIRYTHTRKKSSVFIYTYACVRVCITRDLRHRTRSGGKLIFLRRRPRSVSRAHCTRECYINILVTSGRGVQRHYLCTLYNTYTQCVSRIRSRVGVFTRLSLCVCIRTQFKRRRCVRVAVYECVRVYAV